MPIPAKQSNPRPPPKPAALARKDAAISRKMDWGNAGLVKNANSSMINLEAAREEGKI